MKASIIKPTQKEKNKSILENIEINIDTAKHVFETGEVPVYSPYPFYEGQKLFVSYIIECLKTNQNGLVQSPTGTGKTISLLCSTLSWVLKEQKLGRQPTRIIYTSRTHAQLKQVVQQLTKTGFVLKLAILGSRDQTCINDDLKQLAGQGKELQCRLRVMRKKNLFCKYFHHEDYYKKMDFLGKIADLQQMKLMGKAQEYCPFFYQKHARNTANLILMPYNYLLDEKSSMQELGPLLQNSIIIFDEAHNIPSACENSKQFSLSLTSLSRALQHLGDLREQKLQQQKKNTGKNVIVVDEQDPQKCMKSTANELEMHASFVCLIHSHMQTLPIPPQQSGLVMNVHDFLQCLDNGTDEGEFGKLRGKIKQLDLSSGSIKADIILKPYWALESWFSFLSRLHEMYNIDKSQANSFYYKCQIVYNGSDIKINLFCLDPKVGFERINKMKPRSIILTSGTLSPLNSIPLQLQTQFNKPLACPHIMTKQQVNGCILTQGPNKVRLNFNFQNRDNLVLYKQLGFVLLQIISKTPNGVIVFVPSYVLLEKIKLQLTNCGIMSKLYSKKNIFFEKQNSADFKQILENYLTEACKGKGALLFALARGKISEGLDFSHQKCRAVILVGVPYLASRDIKVMSKMQYLDSKSKTIKSMNGNQWYVCETIRCINQSIGRIIRNKSDYGSIYLLDQRFKKNDILNQISSWARDCLKVVDDFEEFKFKLEIFQEYFKKRSNEEEEAEYFFTSHLGTKLTNKVSPHAKCMKTSISVSTNVSDHKTVDPQKQLQSLKSQIIDKNKKQISKPQSQPTRQRIIFTAKNTKKLPLVEAKQCPVCRLQRRLIKNTECIHELCEMCWDTWLKKDLRCPLCRVRIREKYLIRNI